MTPLAQLKKHMLEDLEVAFDDQEGEMQKAIQRLVASKSDDDAVIFNVGFSGKLNLDKNTVDTVLSFAVKTTVKEKHEIDDPRQGRLRLDDGDKVTATISTRGGPAVPLNSLAAVDVIKSAIGRRRKGKAKE